MPKSLSTDEIRRRWIAFFVGKGHKHLPSDSLVPQNDPSVLFTGAGMNQFKDHFLGRAKLDHPQQRAVTVQKCIRTGDIENVGRTPNHHTFFEMLGNFSFGDYFKKEAIQWAWEFLTDPAIGLGLEKERLSITIFGGDEKLGIPKDTEAESCWRASAPELRNADGSWRIYSYGEHDNFWPADAPSLGPNGPCGPCSEIYYDTKPEQGAPECVAESKDPARYVEVWNLVFTQFNRVDVGKLEPLSQKNIDTGAGLERMARVLQQKPNNYEIDLLFPIVKEVARLAGKEYGKNFDDDRCMRRITDHARAAVFCIADGVQPGKNRREYVVRRLLRQTIFDGRKGLGIQSNFMGVVARVVVKQMGIGYPEFLQRTETVVRLIEEEELAFESTLEEGMAVLGNEILALIAVHISRYPNGKIAHHFPRLSQKWRNKELDIFIRDDPTFGSPMRSHKILPTAIRLQAPVSRCTLTFLFNQPVEYDTLLNEYNSRLKTLPSVAAQLVLPSVVAFVLWDTYGYPYEITVETCREAGINIDDAQFRSLLESAREQSRATSAMSKEIFAGGPVSELKKRYAGQKTAFKGYDALKAENAKVLALVQNEKLIEAAQPGEALVLLDQTPFYGESGGQVGDKGTLTVGGAKHRVLDTQKQDGLVLHRVNLSGPLKAGESVSAEVDPQHRLPTLKNHSATHLLHHALRALLGAHVEQRGSLVAPERLRFDFTHFEQIKPEQLAEIERRVNEMVVSDFKVETEELPIAEAKKKGAMALFGEKYGDRVRVVTMGPSVELCGGTHCRGTGEIGYFRIVSESSVAAGVRRIEALTGAGAVADARRSEELLAKLAGTLKTKKESLDERLVALQEERAALERELESLRKKAANAAASELLGGVKDVKGAKFLAAAVEGADAASLRTTLDGIRKNLKDGAVVLGGAKDGKVALLVSLTPELVQRGAHAGNLLKELAPKVGGKGGGKADMAQGGGTDASKLPEALKASEALLAAMLK